MRIELDANIFSRLGVSDTATLSLRRRGRASERKFEIERKTRPGRRRELPLALKSEVRPSTGVLPCKAGAGAMSHDNSDRVDEMSRSRADVLPVTVEGR